MVEQTFANHPRGFPKRLVFLGLSCLNRGQDSLEQFVSAAIAVPAPHYYQIVFRIDPDRV